MSHDTSKPVRLGFVGTGGMGQCAHLCNYALIPDCEVVAVAELRERTGRLVADRYGIPKVYTDHTEMLAKEELDAIVAIQLFERHGIILMDLVKYGLPIMIEKPLADSVGTARKILAALDKADLKVMVGYHKRSDPASELVKAKIDEFKASGELEEMRYLRVTIPAGDFVNNGFRGRLEGNDPAPELECDPPDEDMPENERGLFGGFVNYYIHQINLVRYFLGENYTVDYAGPNGVVMAGHGKDSGVEYVIEMCPYLTSVDWQESAFVGFKRGYIKLELPAPLARNRSGKVEILKDAEGQAPEVTIPHMPWCDAMYNQATNFIRFVRGEAPAPCEAREAFEDLVTAAEFIRLLAKEGRHYSTYW